MVMRIDVRDSQELQATLLAVRMAGKDLRKILYANARRELGAAWLPALQGKAGTNLERSILLKGARTKVGLDGFQMLAATSKRKFRNGLIPAEDWPAAEFGARNKRKEYMRQGFKVTRMMNRQFRGRQKEGRVAFESASEIGTKLVRTWVVSVVDTYREAVGEE